MRTQFEAQMNEKNKKPSLIDRKLEQEIKDKDLQISQLKNEIERISKQNEQVSAKKSTSEEHTKIISKEKAVY